MAERPSFVSATGPTYVPFSANVFVPDDKTQEDLRYFSGLLNSRVLWKWFAHNAKSRGVGLEINGNVLRRAPIRTIDFAEPADVARHDRMLSLVQQMLDLHAQLDTVRTDQDKNHIQRLIHATDRQIDQLVYELYELSDEEIVVVESEIGKS